LLSWKKHGTPLFSWPNKNWISTGGFRTNPEISGVNFSQENCFFWEPNVVGLPHPLNPQGFSVPPFTILPRLGPGGHLPTKIPHEKHMSRNKKGQPERAGCFCVSDIHRLLGRRVDPTHFISSRRFRTYLQLDFEITKKQKKSFQADTTTKEISFWEHLHPVFDSRIIYYIFSRYL